MKTCSIEGCEKPRRQREWCTPHYMRWYRHGDPTAGQPVRPKMTPAVRFWSKVSKDGPTPAHDGHLGPCWEWAAFRDEHGYGKFYMDGKSRKAHRVSYSFTHGHIPHGIEIDHRCRNSACVRPDHLRLATSKQNKEHVDARKTNTSGYRGVTFYKPRKKWRVEVSHHGHRYYGGYFDDVHEAGKAAKALRNELFTHNDLDRRAA